MKRQARPSDSPDRGHSSSAVSAGAADTAQDNAALREEVRQLRLLLDTPQNVMHFSFDPSYRYIRFNQAHADFVRHNWGLTIREGMNILDIFPDEKERISARGHFDRVLRGESYILKRTYRRLKGEIRYYENTYMPVLEDGRVVAATVSAHDITDWNEKDEEGRKYRSFFDKALEGIFRSTVQGRFIEANREMARILGYESPAELMESITDISSQLYCDKDARDRVLEILRQQEVVKDVETRMFRKDGTPIWVEFNARCEKDEQGRTLFVEGKLTDVSARKEMEQRRQQMMQAEKMASLGLLVAGVAHEINNPNSYLTLNLPLLRDVWQDTQAILDEYSDENGEFVLGGLEYSELRDHLPYLLREMMEAASRIKDIVSRLKDYSRQEPENGHEYVDTNEVVRSALTFIRHKIKQSARHFEIVLPEESPAVLGIPQRLTQVLLNLLDNACDALPEEDGQLSVALRTVQEENGAWVCITVQDNGSGIAPEDMKFIEDPFFTTKRASGGTGLGLSISASIMKEHNGALEFRSVPERGTIATMRIPLAK
ncbi:ATP-binding protein [Desulfovibrio mangrovi]|uniref:PAS domain-containing sensor histidine kinase n=1 Tax=Desulfovibrio mangrovi TaxID=2976983 RepID=UPI0022455820|nr:PAS domain-containing sensor histidine kinase [Desulfovibrio mangrovi]UZP66065.1 ATP-binding protein [Desulfovibrio mangrovi]